MKRKWIVVFLEMILLLVLVGCVSTSDRPTSQASLLAPSPSAFTNTDEIARPSPTALTNTDEMGRPSTAGIPTLTITPTSTAAFLPLPSQFIQPTPLFTLAFPATAEGPFAYDDPTPIATAPAGSYQLKPWSEAQGLALIRYLNQTAYDNDILFAGDFRGSFAAYQQVVRQAAREFLLRYPNSVDQKQVEWQLAFANTLNRADSDEWLVAEISRRLNNGWLDPDDLKNGLEPLGFVAKPVHLEQDSTSYAGEASGNYVMNLFGDNRPAYVWLIQNTEEAYYGYGIYVAIEQLADGSFRVVRIHSRHSFPFNGGPSIEAHELTGDGQPELIVSDWGCEFGCTIGRVSVYQWQQDHFAEISHGNFGSQSDPTEKGLNWEFEVNDQDNSSDIVVTNSPLFDPTFHRRLTWNGEWLHIMDRGMELPETNIVLRSDFQSWIGYAMEYTEFDGIHPLLAYVQINYPEWLGIAFPDFVRFQMAMVDVFSSRVGPAREQLQSIVDSPTDPSKPLVAEAAAAFLEEYEGNEDTYRSCHAANLKIERNWLSLQSLGFEGIAEEWGLRPPSSFCNPRTAFRILLGQLNLRPGDDVTARLREVGVPVLRSIKADLDGDELADWLIVVDTPASERNVQAWVFVNSGESYITVPVYGYRPGWSIRNIGTTSPIRLDSFPFPGERHPATVLQVGDRLSLFVIQHKGLDVDVQHLLSDRDIASFRIDPDTNEVTVDYLERAFEPYQNVYAWEERLGRFLYLSQVDRLIFEEGDYDKAIRVIEDKLSKLDTERYEYRYEVEAPQLYYMLGLAYELQGNPSAAVEAYLKLWREFPASPYALLAREKLQ